MPEYSEGAGLDGRPQPYVLFGCPVCGQVGARDQPCPNRWCRRVDRGWTVVFPIGVHQGELRRALVRYKYRGERGRARTFAQMLAAYLSVNATWFEDFELLTAVPTYTGPGASRCWDPVGEILHQVQPILGPAWLTLPGAVVKRAETPRMQGLTWTQRQRVAAGPLRRALAVPSPDLVAGARILVFDDVLTEGSTLREVARALLGAGAAEVAGLVLARPGWSQDPVSAGVSSGGG